MPLSTSSDSKDEIYVFSLLYKDDDNGSWIYTGKSSNVYVTLMKHITGETKTITGKKCIQLVGLYKWQDNLRNKIAETWYLRYSKESNIVGGKINKDNVLCHRPFCKCGSPCELYNGNFVCFATTMLSEDKKLYVAIYYGKYCDYVIKASDYKVK